MLGRYFRRLAAALAITSLLLFGSAEAKSEKTEPIIPGNAEYSIKLEDRLEYGLPIPNGIPEKYALLISGSTRERFRNNIYTAFQTMTSDMGIRPEHIYILDGDGSRESYPSDAPATKENLKKVLEYLSLKLGPEDTFLVYTTGHGRRRITHNKENGYLHRQESTLELVDDYIPGSEFMGLLDKIEADELFLLSVQCYGGGLARLISSNRWNAVSASTEKEKSTGHTFTHPFFQGISSGLADMNKDGKISVEEAFVYAKANDTSALKGEQSPQIYRSPNASTIFLKN